MSEIEDEFSEIERELAELYTATRDDERLSAELEERLVQHNARLKELHDRIGELLGSVGAGPVH
jgi:chromosome segregation ATPase